jgi:[protein-PII] uridylyltransferase
LTASGLQISSAHISTYGARVVDVFYVKDIFGLKIDQDEKLDALRARLLEAVSPAGDSAETPDPDNDAAGERAEAAG